MPATRKKKSKAPASRRTPRKAAAKKKVTSKRGAKMPESKKTEVKIGAAKGRPMLTWVGKRPLQRVTAFPAQLVEKFDPLGELEKKHTGGLLFHGDNKEVLAYLLANGYRAKVNLIYIDPPFDSGADYVRRVTLRGISGKVKLEGNEYSLGEQLQYTDIWANDNYLQFMYERLLLLKELLADDGTIWLHCDWRKHHHLRLLMDEVFGPMAFKASVTWRSMTSSGYKGKSSLGKSHADLLYYSKGEKFTYNPRFIEITAEMLERYKHEEPDGRKFKDSYLGDVSPETLEELREANLLYVTASGGYRIKHYLDEAKGTLIDDIWDDIDVENSQSLTQTGYPTQKPEQLLRRAIEITSNPDDLILDCFIGSGTTAAVAQKLGRRWIAADINKGAIQTTSKRLQTIIDDQIDADRNDGKQGKLIDDDKTEIPKSAQASFAVFRVNDYDLQIQHNEAVNLACEHIGIKRTKSDSFFEGELGKKLVKVIPFNHPLSLVDLEEIRKELDARPDDDRDVVVVALGKELAVEAWLEEWNRYRKSRNVPNKIEVIELRTDERYGKFFEHKPARARVDIKRTRDKIKVRIHDFVSPTILERLEQQAGVLTPHIDDWRSMVDSVMIDTAYDGKIFNVTYSDVPERKNDLVVGEYKLDAAKQKTTVAVKITDMLGEEVLEARNI